MVTFAFSIVIEESTQNKKSREYITDAVLLHTETPVDQWKDLYEYIKEKHTFNKKYYFTMLCKI